MDTYEQEIERIIAAGKRFEEMVKESKEAMPLLEKAKEAMDAGNMEEGWRLYDEWKRRRGLGGK